MSYAIICDGCDRIFPSDGKVRKVFLDDPGKYSIVPGEHILHFCDDCYIGFINKYKPNYVKRSDLV